MVFQNPDNQIVAAVVEEDVAFGLENIMRQDQKSGLEWKRLLLMWACFLTLSTHRIACRADKNSASRLPALSLLNPNALSLTSQQPYSIRRTQGYCRYGASSLIRTKALPLSILRTRWKKPFLADRVIAMKDGHIELMGVTEGRVFTQVDRIRCLEPECPLCGGSGIGS